MSLTKLDTTNFGDVEIAMRDIAQTVGDLRAQLTTSKTLALLNGVGEGRTGFENLFLVIDQQMTDISDEFWEMYEELIEIEGAYLEADQELATQIASGEQLSTSSSGASGAGSGGGGGFRY